MDATIDRYVATLREPASQRAARADLATFTRWWEQRDRAFDASQLSAQNITVWVRHRQDEVQRVLGHSRLSTTGIYTVPDDDDLKDAVERAGI